MADLKLAETLFKTNETNNIAQAYELVNKYPVALLKINSQKFYHAALAARICHLLNKKDEAMKYAKSAIEIAATLRPAPPGQKATTVNKLREAILITLEEISKG
jgi:hypothetical protein